LFSRLRNAAYSATFEHSEVSALLYHAWFPEEIQASIYTCPKTVTYKQCCWHRYKVYRAVTEAEKEAIIKQYCGLGYMRLGGP